MLLNVRAVQLRVNMEGGVRDAAAGSGASSSAGPLDMKALFSFSGLGPECVNGRAAMVSILAIAATEIATGQTVFQQVRRTDGVRGRSRGPVGRKPTDHLDAASEPAKYVH